MKKLSFILALIGGIGLTFPNHLFAQTPDLLLEITPPVTHLIIQPGKTVVHSLYIENKGQTSLQVTPTLRQFFSDNTSGNPVLHSDEYTLPYLQLQNSDITLDQPFLLPAGQKQQLVMEFRIPEDTLPSEHHFVLLFETQTQETFTLNNNSAAVTGQIASTFILSVVGDTPPKDELSVAKIEMPTLVDSFAALIPKVLVKNTGKFTATTQGQVHFKAWGKTVQSYDIFPTNVLPDSTRYIAAQKITSTQELESQDFVYKPLFLLGPYTVSVVLLIDGEEMIVEHSLVAFPLVLTGLIGVGILLALLYTKTSLFTFDKGTQRK